MTIAAILTVAVSLSLVGAALLLKQGAAKAEVEWQRGTQVAVWMVPTATPVGGQRRQAPSSRPSLRQPALRLPDPHATTAHEAQKELGTSPTESGLTAAQTPLVLALHPGPPRGRPGR